MRCALKHSAPLPSSISTGHSRAAGEVARPGTASTPASRRRASPWRPQQGLARGSRLSRRPSLGDRRRLCENAAAGKQRRLGGKSAARLARRCSWRCGQAILPHQYASPAHPNLAAGQSPGAAPDAEGGCRRACEGGECGSGPACRCPRRVSQLQPLLRLLPLRVHCG